jgi:4-hydroxybenzoate polyprenyltransferase
MMPFQANDAAQDRSFEQRVLASVRLVRPANLVTAAADSLTGWAVVGGSSGVLPWLVTASVCLYAGGVVFNDFFDRHLDALERPERPIPSGLISASAAALLGAVLLLVGIGCGFRASTQTGVIAIAIAIAVLFYDAIAKHQWSGPLVMGSCRALNLLLGLSAVPAKLPHTWFLIFLPLLYIVAVTMLSRGEVHGGSRRTSGIVLLFFAGGIAGLFALHLGDRLAWLSTLPFALLLVLRVGTPLWRAYQSPRAETIRAAVHAGVISLVILDSAIASGYVGVILGAAILSLTVVAAELGRLFPVT